MTKFFVSKRPNYKLARCFLFVSLQKQSVTKCLISKRPNYKLIRYCIVYFFIKTICDEVSLFKTIKLQVNKMLYYNKITHSEVIDKSESQNCIGITNLKSRQCYHCLYYFYITENFQYEIHLCDHCHHCVLKEKASKLAIFRMINAKRGIFRTVSEYEHYEIVNLIETSFLNEKTGVLYKALNEFEQNKRVEI